MSIPSPLKLQRIAKGLRQSDLADLAGTYQTRISRLEYGSAPTPDEVTGISKALDVSPDVIFPNHVQVPSI